MDKNLNTFEKLIGPTLIQPTFVTHLPKELVPLAKLTPDAPTTACPPAGGTGIGVDRLCLMLLGRNVSANFIPSLEIEMMKAFDC